MPNIVVLGDSLAISPSSAEGFPAVLQQKLGSSPAGWRVINAGVRGDTTSGGLQRLDAALTHRPDILVVALGANDGLRGVATDTISRNLSDLITRVQARGVKLLLCGMETPPLRGWPYTLAFHNVFPTLARTHTVPLVPFLLTGVALDPAMNGPDMLHPNAAGARRIAENVWTHLMPLMAARRE